MYDTADINLNFFRAAVLNLGSVGAMGG